MCVAAARFLASDARLVCAPERTVSPDSNRRTSHGWHKGERRVPIDSVAEYKVDYDQMGVSELSRRDGARTETLRYDYPGAWAAAAAAANGVG